ncbi:hypothetical protein Clacol_004860 [Clathrus columnatus]|uniref:NACHT domain-containing protein n=1 Tax=Clathrus columnatus TaxID=1419009 RepID=A0AAV5ADA9_9AGAM|nr:hypothetical protein Clacol_004860 [Clathrus columnatus]
MDRLLQKFNKKKGVDRGSNSEIDQRTLSNVESNQLDGTSISNNELDREKLDDAMRDVSQALKITRDVTGNPLEQDNKAYAYRYEQAAANIVQRLSTFTNIVENIAEAITYTQDIDQNMLVLFETLDSTYKFIEDTKEIETHPSYQRILSSLAKQTVDCAYFIRDYAKVTNFWVRVGKNAIGKPIKSRVQMYQDAFSRLLAEFRTHSTMHTEIAVGRLLEWNQEICERLLPYATGAGLNTGKQCLLGTRVEILDEIVDWINDVDEGCPRLFWLAGPAGVGKSAITHSIAIRFKSIQRLGSFFCFDRNYLVERRREKIFSTIARDLADMDPQIEHQLARIIKKETSLRTTTDLHLQWKNFILEPLHVTSGVSTGPVLIVVDALDESGDPSSRQDLLRVFEKEISFLPANVRILVTSRPENDIMLTFNKLQSHIRTKMMDTIPESESKRDILTYFKANLHGDYFRDAQLKHLAGLSQGLFQWAYLASQFLNGFGNSAGLTVTERYEDLINAQRIRSINDPLDSMYDQILSSLFDSDDPRVMARFHSVIGSIITASEPLSLSSLVALRGHDISVSGKETDIKVVIQHMGSLLSGINDPSSTIRPLHSSFRDYLLDPNRRKGFSIDPSQCHRDFAFGCIRTLTEGLRFNICDITDSHKPNSEVEGLSQRIESSISLPLSYSSRFWALHVSSTAFYPVLAKNVEKFLHCGSLLWLEVMSLLKAVNITAKLMSGLISWSSGKGSHETLHAFAVDGKRFVRQFGEAIAVSAPHVYLSALPFCPQDSIIYKTFINQFPNMLRITSGPVHGWPFVKHGIDVGYVDWISFSHGGKYLALSPGLVNQNTFKLLHSETFDILWAEKEFQSTVFEKDLEFYERTVFSPNAKYIASLHNSSLVVWCLESQEQVIDILFEGRCHPSFEFSNSDYSLFVTYVAGVGAQVWDLGTGTVIHGPFRLSLPHVTAHLHRVSPSGKHIIFVDDVRLYVWDFENDSLITLDHYPSMIYGVFISPNGDCLIAESHGRLILRDLNGNELAYETDNYTFCTAFSKDGKQLATCDRGRLNIWELDGWQSATIRQPSESPNRLRFENVSSDGKFFLAASEEGHYEIWDVKLEQPVRKLAPFEPQMLPIFSPLNRYLGYVTGRQIATVYDIHSEITREFFPDNDEKTDIQDLVFSQDEMFIATLELCRGRIQIWDIASSQIVDTITIPKVTKYPRFWEFVASSNFRYFAYVNSNEDGFSLINRTEPIPVDFLTICNWNSEAFSFDLSEERILISCGLTVFHFLLACGENRAVRLRRNQVDNRWGINLIRRIHFKSNSDAVLIEIANHLGYNIWDAFSGQLLYSSFLEYPECCIEGFIPVHQYLFSITNLYGRIFTLDLKDDARIRFSSNDQHNLQGLPLGSSARLCRDGWTSWRSVFRVNAFKDWLPLGSRILLRG